MSSKINNCQPAKQQKKLNTNKPWGGSKTRQRVFSGLFGLQRENSSLRQLTVNNGWAQMIYSFSSLRFCPAPSLAVLPLGLENEGNLTKPPPTEEELQPWHYFYHRSAILADSLQVNGRRQTDSSSRVAGVAAATGVFGNKRVWLRLCKRRRRRRDSWQLMRGEGGRLLKRVARRESRQRERGREEVRLQKKGGRHNTNVHAHTPSLFSYRKIPNARCWNPSMA